MPIRKVRKGARKQARQKHASKVMSEFRHGATFARTARKFGMRRARKQMIAVALRSARVSRRKKK